LSVEHGTRAPIVVRRIEEKLGLQRPPTCVMGLAAPAYLLGQAARLAATL
jgi:hypothetical protein